METKQNKVEGSVGTLHVSSISPFLFTVKKKRFRMNDLYTLRSTKASASIAYRPELSHLVGLLGDCRQKKDNEQQQKKPPIQWLKKVYA